MPTFKLLWMNKNPSKPAKDDLLGMVMSSHIDSPYLFDISGGKLNKCMEYTSLNKPIIDRPEVDGGPMDAQETLGNCLGFGLLTATMASAP